MINEPLKIVTFFWNDPTAKHTNKYTFGAESHVNKLARMFKKHLTIPHEFICITDNPENIDVSLVRILPIWNEFRDLGRCFVRLGLFANEMKEIIGPRFTMIDLDVVLTGNVNHLFDNKHPFIGYRDSKNPRCISGCFYQMDAGAYSNVYNTFKRLYYMIPEQGRKEWFLQHWNRNSTFVGSDQSAITEIIGEDKVPRIDQSFGVWDYWSIEQLPGLPANCCMVMMNGMTRDASLKEYQDKHPWLIEHYVNV